MHRLGMVYFAIVGGAAALETTQIEEIEEVAWEELMPECLWKFRVKDFGPLTVGIDAHGNSLYHDVQAAREAEAGGALCPPLISASAATVASPTCSTRVSARAGGRTSSTRPASYIDIVKLGWGTAYVTNNLRRKLEVLKDKPVVIGGTFFEVVYARDKLDEYKQWLTGLGITTSRSPTAPSRSRASASSS